MIMKKRMLTRIGMAAAFVGAASLACANPITGTIDMRGSMDLTGGSLGAATGASFGTPAAIVTSASGSYGGVPTGTLVTWDNFSWNPETATPFQIWTFRVGLWTYSFQVDTLSVVTHDDTLLYLSGTGSATIAGPGSASTSTPATWNLDIFGNPGSQNLTYNFTFDDPLTAPDEGSTAAMLGMGILGAGLLRRKLIS